MKLCRKLCLHGQLNGLTAGGAFGCVLGRGVRGPGILGRAVVARAASGAARSYPRALPLALERGVLGSFWEVLLAAMIKFTSHINSTT